MSEKKIIPLAIPNFDDEERRLVDQAIVSNWVSSGGPLVVEFEKVIAEYVGTPTAAATDSGTSALHTALMLAEVGPGDEVLCCPLTYIAAINPIRYVGAQPVFLDCDETLCISPAAVAAFCENECEMQGEKLINKTTGAHVKSLEVIHIFGNMAHMPELLALAEKYNLIVLEDATEALGTRYTAGPMQGKYAGAIGDVGCFSFNGNKTITTGSGGMLVSPHEQWVQRALYLTNVATNDLGADTYRQFIHNEVGYHYRLTNLAAALGLAQMKKLEGFIARKNDFHKMYTQALDGKNGYRILQYNPDAYCNKWFLSLYLEDCPKSRDEMIGYLDANGIQSRPIWTLICDLPPYKECQCADLTTARRYRERVVNLPSSTGLTDEEIQTVIDTLLKVSR
ncbi:aminotransferase class I/II-fold pyridoxal phosphate-dependent enzyme [Ruminococcaceae bacterium OttesenSCG-928-N02]|nr:aminotransferase class I/II-fold pyridoxal phosphate-dependent enzyme [Ruminococcaceae bacterium OttesenSCG-928-N02]